MLTNDKFLFPVQKPTPASVCLLLEVLGNVVNIGSNGQRNNIALDVWGGAGGALKTVSPTMCSVWKILPSINPGLGPVPIYLIRHSLKSGFDFCTKSH